MVLCLPTFSAHFSSSSPCFHPRRRFTAGEVKEKRELMPPVTPDIVSAELAGVPEVPGEVPGVADEVAGEVCEVPAADGQLRWCGEVPGAGGCCVSRPPLPAAWRHPRDGRHSARQD